MPKKIVKKGKKKRKNSKPSKRWEKYKIEGDKIVRTTKFCPRCGPGYFLSRHGNRLYCGHCHYTTFIKKEETKKQVNK